MIETLGVNNQEIKYVGIIATLTEEKPSFGNK